MSERPLLKARRLAVLRSRAFVTANPDAAAAIAAASNSVVASSTSTTALSPNLVLLLSETPSRQAFQNRRISPVVRLACGAVRSPASASSTITAKAQPGSTLPSVRSPSQPARPMRLRKGVTRSRPSRADATISSPRRERLPLRKRHRKRLGGRRNTSRSVLSPGFALPRVRTPSVAASRSCGKSAMVISRGPCLFARLHERGRCQRAHGGGSNAVQRHSRLRKVLAEIGADLFSAAASSASASLIAVTPRSPSPTA